MRHLHVKNGVVTNIVEYGTETPPQTTPAGDVVVPDLTGTLTIGAVYDVADDMKVRRLSAFEVVILQELFRLTNEVRVLKAQATYTNAQYKTYLKGTM